MELNSVIQIVAYIALAAAFLSSMFWVFLAYTWWKTEKKRIKESPAFGEI